MISKKLKQARENKGLSQSDVSRQLNISRQSISKWENNRGYPDIDNLVRLCQIYEVSLDDLLLDKNENIETLSYKNNYNNEWLLLLILTIILTLSAPLGVIFLPFIFMRNKKNNIYHKLIFITCIICLIINIYSITVIIGDFIHSRQEVEVILIEED